MPLTLPKIITGMMPQFFGIFLCLWGIWLLCAWRFVFPHYVKRFDNEYLALVETDRWYERVWWLFLIGVGSWMAAAMIRIL